jgi:hypothetical protein
MKTAKPNKQKRVIMRIELTPAAKQEVEVYCDRVGMTQIAAMSRLAEWFGNQSDEIQALVQDHYPGSIKPDVAKLILQRAVKP